MLSCGDHSPKPPAGRPQPSGGLRLRIVFVHRKPMCGESMTDVPTEGGPPDPPASWARGPNGPTLHAGVTVACAVLVGLIIVSAAGRMWISSTFDVLDDPLKTLVHVAERDLDHSAAIDRAAAWERGLYRVFGYDSDTWFEDLDGAYDRLYDHMLALPARHAPADINRLAAHHSILRGERFASEGMAAVLDRMDDNVTGSDFAGLLNTLYGSNEIPREAKFVAPAPVGTSVPGALWSLDCVEARWAERQNRPDAVAAARHRIDERGRRLLIRGRWVMAVYLAVVSFGVGAAVWHGRRLARPVPVSRGLTVAPWSFRVGVQVLLRCFAVMFLAGILVGMVSAGALMPVVSLISGLPILVIMHRYLFAPDRSTPFHGFGMDPPSLAGPRLLLFAIGLAAVDQVGCLAIRHVTDWAGIHVLIEEGLDEGLLFGGRPTVILTMLDGVVWAPLFEELLFRGVLYVTLRTRLRPMAAALVSGGIFGVIHLYSLGGFFEVFWTGCILALGYEKCRSLWPCILAHAFNNFIVFGWLLAVYR